MLPPKKCPMCKERIIESWESVCLPCWNKLIEHDLCQLCKGIGTVSEEKVNGNRYTITLTCPECLGTGFTGMWRSYMIGFNIFRELCRECGFDPIEGIYL